MIRALWVALVGGGYTAILAFEILLAHWFRRPKWSKETCNHNPTKSARSILWASGVKVDVEGAEKLAGGGQYILVSNHESWFDVMALCANLPGEYRFAIKKELEKVPLWGPAFVACGHISVDRNNRQAAISSIQRARTLAGDDASIFIVFFPEGTRSPTGALLPFKKGAFVLALQLGVPVVPVAVIGGRQVMGKRSPAIHSGRMRVVIGDPIPVEGLPFEARDGLVDRSWAAVAALRGTEGPTEAP